MVVQTNTDEFLHILTDAQPKLTEQSGDVNGEKCIEHADSADNIKINFMEAIGLLTPIAAARQEEIIKKGRDSRPYTRIPRATRGVMPQRYGQEAAENKPAAVAKTILSSKKSLTTKDKTTKTAIKPANLPKKQLTKNNKKPVGKKRLMNNDATLSKKAPEDPQPGPSSGNGSTSTSIPKASISDNIQVPLTAAQSLPKNKSSKKVIKSAAAYIINKVEESTITSKKPAEIDIHLHRNSIKTVKISVEDPKSTITSKKSAESEPAVDSGSPQINIHRHRESMETTEISIEDRGSLKDSEVKDASIPQPSPAESCAAEQSLNQPGNQDADRSRSVRQPNNKRSDIPKRQMRQSVELKDGILIVNGEEIPYQKNMARNFVKVERTPEEERRRALNNLRSRASRARAKLGETRKYVKKNN